MRNPNKPIPVIDESPKGRNGIFEMIERMMNTDEDGNNEPPEKKKQPA